MLLTKDNNSNISVHSANCQNLQRIETNMYIINSQYCQELSILRCQYEELIVFSPWPSKIFKSTRLTKTMYQRHEKKIVLMLEPYIQVSKVLETLHKQPQHLNLKSSIGSKFFLGVFLTAYVCFPSYLRIVSVSSLQHNFELLFFPTNLRLTAKPNAKKLSNLKLESIKTKTIFKRHIVATFPQ